MARHVLANVIDFYIFYSITLSLFRYSILLFISGWLRAESKQAKRNSSGGTKSFCQFGNSFQIYQSYVYQIRLKRLTQRKHAHHTPDHLFAVCATTTKKKKSGFVHLETAETRQHSLVSVSHNIARWYRTRRWRMPWHVGWRLCVFARYRDGDTDSVRRAIS